MWDAPGDRTLNLIGVVRLSTPGQVSDERAGAERQREDIRLIQRIHNARIDHTIEVIESGSDVLDQEDFQQLFLDLARPDIDGVATSSQDRLVRPDGFMDLMVLHHFRENRKRIFTPGGIIDPASSGGFIESSMRAVFAGMEKFEIRKRTMGAKSKMRNWGWNPNGRNALPRGVLFDRATKTWFYDLDPERIAVRSKRQTPGEARLILRAFQLLVEQDLSLQAIADEIGGGFSDFGLGRSLRNPIWMGIRRYHQERVGKRIRPAPHIDPNSGLLVKGRKYRNSGPRKVILEQQVIEPGLVSRETFEAAQRILSERAIRWGRRKPGAGSQFLCSGLLVCACGEPWYPHVEKNPRYRCSSKLSPKSEGSRRMQVGRGCGAPTIRRDLLDPHVIDLLGESLLDNAFLDWAVKGESRLAKPADTHERDRALKVVADERARLIDLYQSGEITRKEYDERKRGLDGRRKAMDTTLPAPAAPVDIMQLAKALVIAFTNLKRRPFEQQRELLQRATREIIISGQTITSVTFQGGFLSGLYSEVKPGSRSTARYHFDLQADLKITFPQPIEIKGSVQ